MSYLSATVPYSTTDAAPANAAYPLADAASYAMSVFGNFQSIACETASKVHNGLCTFFTDAPLAVQEGFEEWRSTTVGGIRNYIAGQVVPAKNKYTAERLQELRTRVLTTRFQELEQDGISAKEIQFTTSDGVVLNGVQLGGEVEGVLETKCILYFVGNGNIWEDSLAKIKMIHQLSGVMVRCYNNRSLGISTGTLNLGETTPVNDGKEIIKAMIAQGIRPSVHGYSLGGGIATNILADLADEGIVLDLTNERSFTSIPDVVSAIFPVIGFIVHPILYWSNWILDSESALLRLRGKLIILVHPKDPVIQHAAQFSRAVDKWQVEGVDQNESPLRLLWCESIEMSEEVGDNDAHCRSWFRDEQEHYRRLIREQLK